MNYFRPITFLLMVLSCAPLVRGMEAPLPPKLEQPTLLLTATRFYDKTNQGILSADIYNELCKFISQKQYDSAITFWTLQLFQKENKTPECITEIQGKVSCFEVDKEHKKLFVGLESGKILIVDLESGNSEKTIDAFDDNPVDHLFFNKNNNTLISVAWLGNEVKIFDLNTVYCDCHIITTAGNDVDISVSFKVDLQKNQLITTSYQLINTSYDSRWVIEIWDLNNFELLQRLPTNDYLVNTVHDNYLYLYKDSQPSELLRYDTNARTFETLFKKNNFEFIQINKSRNQLIASFKKIIQVWDLQQQKIISILKKNVIIRSLDLDEKRNTVFFVTADEFIIGDPAMGIEFLKLPIPHHFSRLFDSDTNQLILAQEDLRNNTTKILKHNFNNEELATLFKTDIDAIRLAQYAFQAYLKNSRVDLRADERMYNAFVHLPQALQQIMSSYVLFPGQESWKEWILGKSSK